VGWVAGWRFFLGGGGGVLVGGLGCGVFLAG